MQTVAKEGSGSLGRCDASDSEAEAQRLGAIVREWLDASQLEIAPQLTECDLAEDGATVGARTPQLSCQSSQTTSAATSFRRGGADAYSDHMGELERQLAGLGG
jgi:hypothetical protein